MRYLCYAVNIIFISFLIFCIYFLTINRNKQIKELVQVTIFFRHGLRSPVETFPNDAYKYTDKQFWPRGYGALTEKGRLQILKLGERLNARYNKLIGDVYSGENQLLITSTNSSRTIESAELLLTKLLPYETNYVRIKIFIDYFLHVLTYEEKERKICPRFYEEMEKALLKNRNLINPEKNSELYEYLEQHTGRKMDLKNICEVYYIWEALYYQKAEGYELPEWSKNIFPDKMIDLFKSCYKLHSMGTDLQTKLATSPYLEVIINRLNNFVENKIGPKIFLHSGHDYGQIWLMNAFGYINYLLPKPASGLAIELYKVNIEKSYFVQVVHFEKPGEKGKILNISGCGDTLCKFDEFLKTCHLQMIDNYRHACKSL